MAQQKIFGYANRISVRPGEEISFHVNCDGASEADAQLVRLIYGDTGEAGPGHVEVEVDSPANGRWKVKKQFTQLGSFLKVTDPENRLAVSGDFSLMAFIWPTMPHRGNRQTILGRWDTLHNPGTRWDQSRRHLEFWVGDGTEVDYVTAELPLVRRYGILLASHTIGRPAAPNSIRRAYSTATIRWSARSFPTTSQAMSSSTSASSPKTRWGCHSSLRAPATNTLCVVPL